MSDLKPASRLEYLPNFVEDATNEFPDLLQGFPNLIKISEITTGRLADIHTYTIDMAYLRLISNASGLILDEIGSRVGILRDNLEDEQYRSAIITNGLSQGARATRDDIVKSLMRLGFGLQPKIFKGENNYVEVVMNTDCIGLSGVPILEDLFPIETNLRIGNASHPHKVFGFRSIHEPDRPTSKCAPLDSVFDTGDPYLFHTNTPNEIGSVHFPREEGSRAIPSPSNRLATTVFYRQTE